MTGNKLPKQLLEWINENEPSDEMAYKKAYFGQIELMRGRLPRMLNLSSESKDIQVVSTHISKSILLPVTRYAVNGKGEIIVSDNFYHSVLSCNVNVPLSLDIPQWVRGSYKKVNPLYAHGFKSEWVYGSVLNNQGKFSVMLPDFDAVVIFFHLIGQAMKVYN